jgi:UDP-3-O-[3-hydroxymyristoyl] glucosamine N-acyltransferase
MAKYRTATQYQETNMESEHLLPTGWQPNECFISETAQVSSLAHIAPMVVIGPHTIIEADAVVQRCTTVGAHVRIARASIIRPGATIGFGARIGRDVIVGAFCVLGSGVVLSRGSHLSDFATLNTVPEEPLEDDSSSVVPLKTNISAAAQLGKNTVLGLGAYVGKAVLENGVVIGCGGRILENSHIGAFVSIGFNGEVHGARMGRRAQLGASGRLERHGLDDNEALLSSPFEHELIS